MPIFFASSGGHPGATAPAVATAPRQAPAPQSGGRTRRQTTSAWRQRGATLLEFTLVAISLLGFGTLIVEAAHWQMVRQIAYVALLDSARAGATHVDRAEAMQQAFTQAFLPRFASGQGADPHKRQSDHWTRIRPHAQLPAWRIEILQPDDPNILHTRLTYLHEPLSPATRAVLRAIGQTRQDCMRPAWSHGLLPIRLTLDIESHVRASTRQTPAVTENVVVGEWNCAQAGA